MESFNTALRCASFLIPWNAVMLALGILTAVIAAEILVKKRGLYKDLALDCCIIAIPSGIVGARLFSALSGKIGWGSFFDLTKVGMNLPGALLFVAIGILIYCRAKRIDAGTVFNLLAPAAFFGLAAGRWSDFFLCDGLGPAAGNVPKFFPLVTFTKAYFTDHTSVAYAVFFADFLVCLALGVAALLLYRKLRAPGKTARITMIAYVLCEFALEWLRDGSTRQIVIGDLRFNQIVLLLMLLLLVAAAIVSAKKKPAAQNGQEEPEQPEEQPEAPEEQPEQSEEQPEAPDEQPEAPEKLPEEPEGEAVGT